MLWEINMLSEETIATHSTCTHMPIIGRLISYLRKSLTICKLIESSAVIVITFPSNCYWFSEYWERVRVESNDTLSHLEIESSFK